MGKDSNAAKSDLPEIVYKTTMVYYQSGDHFYEQGVKGGKCGTKIEHGIKKDYNGFGGVSTNTSASLKVGYVNYLKNYKRTVTIKEDFRNAGFSRFTTKLLDKIKKTMPSQITLEMRDGGLRVDSKIIDNWIEAVRNLP